MLEDYDTSVLPPAFNGFTRDVVIFNTNLKLKEDATYNNTEPSIAINPTEDCIDDETKCNIFITSFSGFWGTAANTTAPIWWSKDGGKTWMQSSTIPPPPMAPPAWVEDCPCDQTVDYAGVPKLGGGQKGLLIFSSMIARKTPPTPLRSNIFTASTLGPPNEWKYDKNAAGAARPTNLGGDLRVDQPWVLSSRENSATGLDAVYVAYDFGTLERVSWAQAAANGPPFTTDARDIQSGVTTGGIVNAGLRIAPDPRVTVAGMGRAYSVYQEDRGENGPPYTAQRIRYRLNATTDSGQHWRFAGDLTAGGRCMEDRVAPNPPGCIFANGQSRQGNNNDFKFGGEPGSPGVNMFMGGVDAIAVDPVNGDIYVVWGDRRADAGVMHDHLILSHFHINLAGTEITRVGAEVDFTLNQVAALPAIAVAQNQTIAVLYDTYTTVVNKFPQFQVYLTQSTNHGVTFEPPANLQTFEAPAASDPAIPKQRELGDYQQLKAVGNRFFGVFVGSRCAKDLSLQCNGDPIFVYAAANPP